MTQIKDAAGNRSTAKSELNHLKWNVDQSVASPKRVPHIWVGSENTNPGPASASPPHPEGLTPVGDYVDASA